MIDHPNLLRILPVAIFVIFLLTEGLCRKSHSKNIILENEDAIVLAKKGSNLKVKCHYSEGYEPDDYEWKKIKDDRHITISPVEILSTSQWLNLVNVGFDDEGQYSCAMNGFIGNETVSEKRDFVLKITNYTREPHGKIKPKFQKVFTKDVPSLVNRTLHLNCPFTSTSDTEFSWYKNDQIQLFRKKAIIEGFGAIDNEYSLKSVILSDTGNYTCVVQNKYGLIRYQFAVVVYDDENKMPLYFDYPRDLSLKSGDRAMFFCHAFDYGNKEIDWYFLNSTNPMDIDIETVDLSQFKKMENENDVTLLSGKLIIEPVTIHDAGWYICVQTGFERPLMADAKLSVDKIKVTSAEQTNQNENISDDKRFVLNLLTTFSSLPMDKQLKLRKDIETLVHNTAFPDVYAPENVHSEQKNAIALIR